MSTAPIQFPADLQALVDREMARGGFASHEELLRSALEYWADHCEAVAAIEEGLDEMAAGKGRPWEEFDREFRQRNRL